MSMNIVIFRLLIFFFWFVVKYLNVSNCFYHFMELPLCPLTWLWGKINWSQTANFAGAGSETLFFLNYSSAFQFIFIFVRSLSTRFTTGCMCHGWVGLGIHGYHEHLHHIQVWFLY